MLTPAPKLDTGGETVRLPLVRRLFGQSGRRVAATILSLVTVVAAFTWGLPALAPYRDVSASLLALEARYLLPLAIFGAMNLCSTAVVQCAALPGLRFRSSLVIDWMTSAVANVVPGGGAIATGMTWSMYRAEGLERSPILQSFVVTGLGHTLVKLGTPLLAVVWLSSQRPVGRGLIQAAVVGSALFTVVVALVAVLLVGPRAVSGVGKVLDRFPLIGTGWSARLDGLRSDTLSLLAQRGWPLAVSTLAGHTAYYILLVLCLRALGVTSAELSLAAILAALAFGRLVTAIPLTPGGLGVMELGLAAALAAVGTAPQGAIVAAVLLFRLFTFALPIPLGAIAALARAGRAARAGTSARADTSERESSPPAALTD